MVLISLPAVHCILVLTWRRRRYGFTEVLIVPRPQGSLPRLFSSSVPLLFFRRDALSFGLLWVSVFILTASGALLVT